MSRHPLSPFDQGIALLALLGIAVGAVSAVILFVRVMLTFASMYPWH
jgi:hypothetical protein